MKQLLFAAMLLFSFETYCQDIIIRDINVISMTSKKVDKKQSVWIQDGKIKQIGKFSTMKIAASATIIEGKNQYLLPGLADMHLHLPTMEKVDSLLINNVRAGITHIRVMNSELNQLELKNRLKNDRTIVAPTLHFSQLITKETQLDEQQFDSLMLNTKTEGLDFIKLFSLADKETFDRLMVAAKTHNMTVCGHYPRYAPFGKSVLVDFETVLNYGFKSIEHLGGYEIFEEGEALKKAIEQTKTHQLYNCPTLDWDLIAYNLLYADSFQYRLTYKLFSEEQLQQWKETYQVQVEKAGEEAILSLKERGKAVFERKQKLLKLLADNGCLLLLGSDSGSFYQGEGVNVYEEMYNWSKAGVDNYTILQAATINPARFFNQEKEWGTIEVGKEGNVIILDKNPLEAIEHITTIKTTILKGKIYN